MNRNRSTTAAAFGLGAGFALAAVMALVNPAVASAATVPVDLYAVTGSATLGAQAVTVWGYNTTNAAVARPGGPTLTVDQGDTVVVTLHNQLAAATSIQFQGQSMIPDITGAPAGGTKTYTFTAARPGTYLYEAGLVRNAQHQVAMGLYGALVVRPAAAGRAYDSTATAFDDQAVLVLSEVDPALNNAANPAAFDMRKFAPRYFLINGKTYPATDPIPTTAGRTVLLRYLNAGTQYHSMAVLGAHQRVIALDGSPLTDARRYVAETFGPGQTADALVATAPAIGNRRLAIHDGSLLLHSSNTTGTGGMLTFLTVTGSPAGPDNRGPATRAVAYTAGTLTATVDDTATGGTAVAGAEYFVDTVGAQGSGTALLAADGAFNAPNEGVTRAVTVPPGRHVLYVRGRDTAGNWGVVSSVLVTASDVVGPATTGAVLTPSPTNASAVAVHATASDTASGGSTITAAEYFVDAVGANGGGAAMTVGTAGPVSAVDGTIASGTVGALPEGAHVVSVHSRDAAGNWGPFTTVTLTVDRTGPATTAVSAAPNPNNGTLPFNSATPAVRVTASVTDPLSGGVRSGVAAAEAFIDTVGANGTGIMLAATDGAFNSPAESAYADIPLASVAALSNGNHTISVHARDAAGNWSPVVPASTTTLLVDKAGPTVTAVVATPNPTGAVTTVTLSAAATDAFTGVTRAEWFRGTDPGAGNGTAMTLTGTGPYTLSASIDTANFNDGANTLSVRARDGVGNWGPVSTTVLTVTRRLYYSTSGNTNPPTVGGTADDADIYLWNGAAHSRVIDATAIPGAPLPTGANVDGFDRVDATHFYMSFTGTVTVPGLGGVADEDVVFYNAGSWQLFFDGSVRGVAATDLDAISVVGGTLYFSTDNTTVPPGVAGAGDDADIYRWNGASSYTRVIDASVVGWPTTNVDGLVWVSPTHAYLSYSADTTAPDIGAVQDEDVVQVNGAAWSVYVDGTVHGLTSTNLDVDAFDVP